MSSDTATSSDALALGVIAQANDQIGAIGQVLETIGLLDGIRVVTARILKQEKGGVRRRPGYRPSNSTQRIMEHLQLQGEHLYSRWSDAQRFIQPERPSVRAMSQTTFAALAGTDHVVVLNPAEPAAMQLLKDAGSFPGQIEPVSSDLYPLTMRRLDNARDLNEVAAWMISQW